MSYTLSVAVVSARTCPVPTSSNQRLRLLGMLVEVCVERENTILPVGVAACADSADAADAVATTAATAARRIGCVFISTP